MARCSVWTWLVDRSGLEQPPFSPLARGEKTAGVAPAHTFSEKCDSGRGGIGMRLTIQKSYELLAAYGCFAREICDKCGIVLGAVRFTRHGESEVYCSRECRGDAPRSATLSLGRPRKYKTDRANAEPQRRDNSRSIGWHPNVEKTVRIPSETKSLQRQKLLSRTRVLGDRENRSVRAGERKWRPRQDSRCTRFRLGAGDSA
jgi:hypothetical protein